MDADDASEPMVPVGSEDDQAPGPSYPSGPAPTPAGQPLSGKQRALLEALTAMDQRLGEMYLALLALQQPSNRERFSQAGHTLRELINRLPVALGLSTDALLKERLGDRLQQPENAWDTAVRKSTCLKDGNWTGTIDRPLATALTAIHRFFDWKKMSQPRRRHEMTQTVRGLDVSGRRLPERIEQLVVAQWDEMRDYFVSVCHYRVKTNEEEFLSYLDVLETFILDRVRPRTFATFDALDAIIEEASRADERRFS
jgi:hypothetical protein